VQCTHRALKGYEECISLIQNERCLPREELTFIVNVDGFELMQSSHNFRHLFDMRVQLFYSLYFTILRNKKKLLSCEIVSCIYLLMSEIKVHVGTHANLALACRRTLRAKHLD
jgi:hypothetical protein